MTDDFAHMHPREIRERFRNGLVDTCTGKALGHVQAGLVVLPSALAYDFLLFCQRNPKPLSALEVTDTGDPILRFCAPGADVRTDLAWYQVYVDGELVDEPHDLHKYWRADLVAFILAGSLTWENALLRNGIPLRQLEAGKVDSIYITNIQCVPAGRFRGPLTVGMRPVPGGKVARAVQVSGRFPRAHGAPVHIGDPSAIGIRDLSKPDFGDPPVMLSGDVPVFWATTASGPAVARNTKAPLMIVHKPNYVFITDLIDEQLADA